MIAQVRAMRLHVVFRVALWSDHAGHPSFMQCPPATQLPKIGLLAEHGMPG